MSRAIVLAAALLFVVGCSEPTVEPSITFDDEGCSSSDVSNWPPGPPEIEVTNNRSSVSGVVMGTYTEGHERDDLVAYGSDVSTRPTFINALEIFQAQPGTSTLMFDHGPGMFFMVCMPDTNTMVVLEDLVIDD